MEILYSNKFLIASGLGIIVALIYYKYTNIHSEPVEFQDEQTGEIVRVDNKENVNKDKCLYIFMAVSVGVFMILYMTEENVDDVMGEIDTGSPGF
jgi:hypothetical protein